jgi:hypothetical protein
MKKSIFVIMLLLLLIPPVFAATNDFTADANITVSGVTFGSGTTDMLIMNGSTAESWTFNNGTFTVTNPGTFKVGSADSSVKSIKITQGGTNLECAENSNPGTSYVTLPTAAGTYTVEPSTTTDCTSLCTALDHVATYNPFPTCGAATCDSGYQLSGSGASATCIPAGGIPLHILTQINKANQQQDATEQSQTNETAPNAITEENPSTNANPSETETPNSETMESEPATDSAGNITLEQMAADAEITASGDVKQIIELNCVKRDLAAEINFNKTIVAKIVKDAGATAEIRNTINSFVTYGTPSTRNLGAGERGGVVNSFKAAFGKLPTTAEDWNDVIKIANGRWPGKSSAKAEDRAEINFRIVYLREPDRSNPHDDAAITVMAYGLRPANRNLDSEKAAIRIFKDIYGYNPEKPTAWDVVRAIAYSGATR